MNNPSRCIICNCDTKKLFNILYDDRHGYPDPFSISRCPSCGFCRTEPSLGKESLSSVYEKYYPRNTLRIEDIICGFTQSKEKSPRQIWLDGDGIDCYRYISPGTRVLDVGCGNCISLLMSLHLGAQEAVGLEVDPSIEKFARELHLDVFIGHLGDLPANRGCFDYILARQVLEHEPNPEEMILNMRNRLQDKGRIIMSVPHVNALYRFIFRKQWLHWHVPYHINHFSKKSMMLLAARCGMSIESMKTITPNAWLTYQMHMLRVSPKPGQRDPFWDPHAPAASNPKPKRIHLLSGIYHLCKNKAFGAVSCVLNRSIDALGVGESLLVVMVKK